MMFYHADGPQLTFLGVMKQKCVEKVDHTGGNSIIIKYQFKDAEII